MDKKKIRIELTVIVDGQAKSYSLRGEGSTIGMYFLEHKPKEIKIRLDKVKEE